MFKKIFESSARDYHTFVERLDLLDEVFGKGFFTFTEIGFAHKYHAIFYCHALTADEQKEFVATYPLESQEKLNRVVATGRSEKVYDCLDIDHVRSYER